MTSVSPAAGSELKADDEITITMLVTNNSDRAIKDVVELYYAPPYDEKDAPIEKASVNLGAFAKTVSIEPGLSQTLTLTVPVSDMKSYDAYNVNNNGHYGYELEAGDYVISLRTDAHTVKNTTGVVSGGSITYKISEDILLDANGNKVDEFVGDGIIVSTPTGSTAYSLSAGGSILTPDIEAFILTPVCAHSLHNRPIVYADSSELRVFLAGMREKMSLCLDGRFACSIGEDDQIVLRKAPYFVEFIKRKDSNFFSKLLFKLNKWSN